MIAWWMAQLALLGVLLAAAALAADAALRVARRPTRWAWVVAMALLVSLGATAPARRLAPGVTRDWQAVSVAAPAPGVSQTVGTLQAVRGAWTDALTALDTAVQRGWTRWHAVVPEGTERALLLAWLAASTLALTGIVVLHWQFRRRRAHWPRGVLHGTTVRISADTGPAVVGVTSSEIVVPQWLLERDAGEQSLVLAHEQEHVRAHDPLLLAVAQVVVVLLPWHPAVWWMAARLRLALELDCDRRVLARGASARDYGTLLIDLTDHRAGVAAALAAFSCTPSHLERRLVAMTPTRLKYPLVRALATGALASLALLAACEAKLPTAEEMNDMTAATATAAAGRVTLMDTATVRYFVNDVAVSKEAANALRADQIVSVNVLARTPVSGGQVRIVTTGAADSIGRVAAGGTATPLRRAEAFVVRSDSVAERPGSTTAERKPATIATTDPAFARIMMEPTPKFTGLMVVDGVITDPAVAGALRPERIVSVNVLKGNAATTLYSDPRAANGVIQIVTKDGRK